MTMAGLWCNEIRDANSPATFIPRGIGEWQFPISRGSGKLKANPRVFGEFQGIIFPLNEQSLVHIQHYTLHSFMFYKQHMIEKSTS